MSSFPLPVGLLLHYPPSTTAVFFSSSCAGKHKVTRWYRLLGPEELYDEENPLGEIELSVQWLHDPRAKDIATRKLSLLEIVQRTLGIL